MLHHSLHAAQLKRGRATGMVIGLVMAAVLATGLFAQRAEAAGPTRITTDRAVYSVGDTATITYTIPGPGFIAISDIQGDRVSQLRWEDTLETTGVIRAVVTPPAGTECLQLVYYGILGDNGFDEVCFEVRLAPAPNAAKIAVLQNRATSLALDSNPAQAVSAQAANSGASQKWVLEPGMDGAVYLRNLATGLYLDSNPSKQVYTRAFNGGASQQWQVETAANGATFVRNTATGFYLDSNPTQAVYTREFNGGLSQQWSLAPVKP